MCYYDDDMGLLIHFKSILLLSWQTQSNKSDEKNENVFDLQPIFVYKINPLQENTSTGSHDPPGGHFLALLENKMKSLKIKKVSLLMH